MLAEIPGKVPEGSNADTLLGSGGFRCRYLLRFWRVPVQIPGQLLEGSCADTCWGSWPWFLYHCATPLHACMCMIVYKAEAFKLLGIAPEFIFTPMDLPWTNGWPNHDQKSRSRNSESCPKFTKPSSVVLEMSASSWAWRWDVRPALADLGFLKSRGIPSCHHGCPSLYGHSTRLFRISKDAKCRSHFELDSSVKHQFGSMFVLPLMNVDFPALLVLVCSSLDSLAISRSSESTKACGGW